MRKDSEIERKKVFQENSISCACACVTKSEQAYYCFACKLFLGRSVYYGELCLRPILERLRTFKWEGGIVKVLPLRKIEEK